MNNEEKIGSVKIADDVIATCAMSATTKTEGVSDLSAGITDTISKNILGKTSLSKGIKILQEEQGITVDVHIVVEYGVKIPEVAWNVQENVKKEIESITGLKIKSVNIFVQGVSFGKNAE